MKSGKSKDMMEMQSISAADAIHQVGLHPYRLI